MRLICFVAQMERNIDVTSGRRVPGRLPVCVTPPKRYPCPLRTAGIFGRHELSVDCGVIAAMRRMCSWAHHGRFSPDIGAGCVVQGLCKESRTQLSNVSIPFLLSDPGNPIAAHSGKKGRRTLTCHKRPKRRERLTGVLTGCGSGALVSDLNCHDQFSFSAAQHPIQALRLLQDSAGNNLLFDYLRFVRFKAELFCGPFGSGAAAGPFRSGVPGRSTRSRRSWTSVAGTR